MMLIQDSSSKTGCYTTGDYFMSLKVHADSKCSSLDTTLHRRDTLVTTRLWSWYPETFGGPKCGKPWRTVTMCDTCSRSKIPRHRPYGLLQPLLIPETPWTSISMDFIVDLPKSKSFDSVFVVVDRLTNMAHFVPCNKTIIGKEMARLFLENVYKYHGLLDDIISDRGMKFTSKF